MFVIIMSLYQEVGGECYCVVVTNGVGIGISMTISCLYDICWKNGTCMDIP